MKVLFQPRRRAPEQRGGDFIALEHTLAQLEARGVTCDISTDPRVDLSPYALVHLYGVGDPYTALEYALNALRQHKPLVVTPIYWRHQQWLAARLIPEAPLPEFQLDGLALADRERVRRIIQLEEEIATRVLGFIVQHAARVFVLSHMEGEILREDFGARPEQLVLTYNGVAPRFAQGDGKRFLRTYGIPQDNFVLAVARVEERKNTLGVIRAWQNETTPLVLIGRAPDPTYLEWCRAAAGPNVYFLGALPPDVVADAGAAAKVHVMASWWEEQGMAALEAGLAGCNVVMSQNSPGREYFGEMCFTCDPADARSIHDALCAALTAPRHPELAALIRERYTWEAAAQILHATYEQVVPEPNRDRTNENKDLLALASALCELQGLREPDVRALTEQRVALEAWTQELSAMLNSDARTARSTLRVGRDRVHGLLARTLKKLPRQETGADGFKPPRQGNHP